MAVAPTLPVMSGAVACFFGFVIGWLRTEENMFLTVPIDEVKKMPARCQELLGYKAHSAIGVVDVGSPMALLK